MSARLEYTSEHRQFRDMVHDFVEQTVVPAHEEWEKAGSVDRSLFTEAGKLGLLAFSVPEEFGGAGLGIFEASLMMQAIAASGGGQTASSAIHMSIFGMHPVIKHGSEEMKQVALPRIVSGDPESLRALRAHLAVAAIA